MTTESQASGHGNYLRFAATITPSIVTMYGSIHLDTYALDHVQFSQTRMWMALFMGAIMAIMMLVFMLGIYNSTVNMEIFAGSAVAFALPVWLVRCQEIVGDIAWMKALIPHHSIAILTSERANKSDPRVRELAYAIIKAQQAGIVEMKAYIEDIEIDGGTAAGSPRVER